MTSPGYPIPADWCAYHPYVRHQALPTTAENECRFPATALGPDTDLAMINYPHNPSGQNRHQGLAAGTLRPLSTTRYPPV